MALYDENPSNGGFQIEDRVIDNDTLEYIGTVVDLDPDPQWVYVRWDYDPSIAQETNVRHITHA